MVSVIAVSVGLLGWSFLGNLWLGETLYVPRNLVLTAGLLVLARRLEVWPWLGLEREWWRNGLRWGAVATLVVAGAIGLGMALEGRLDLVTALLADERANLPAPELAFHALVRIPLGTAVFEEVAFRGVLLAMLLRVTSPGRAVAWSSLVFGLWHVAPTIVALRINDVVAHSAEGVGAILGAVAITTVAGVVFCLLRLGSKSLLAPVLAHWATNSLGLLAAAATSSTA